MLDVLPVKIKFLNQLELIIARVEAPLVIERFGALVTVPPLLAPKFTKDDETEFLTNPPVPVHVKLSASPQDKQTKLTDVSVRTMF